MAPLFGIIRDLQPGKSKIALQLRLVRCYEVPEFKKRDQVFSLECIFHDKQGDRIHASIQRSLVAQFQSILHEKKVFSIYNYVVGGNIMKTKTTDNTYKLLFFKETRICELFDDDFPNSIFNFKSFDEIAAMENTYDAAMFDVVGVIVSTYRLQEKDINGHQAKLMDFVLENNEHKTLACTLWDSYAQEFTDYLATEPSSPVGVIIQCCRANTYRGENRLTNAYFATNIIFDESIPELKECRRSFIANNNARAISLKDSNTRKDNSDEYIQGKTPTKTISQLYGDEEIGQFWVRATILCVEIVGAWAYLACNICLKKLKPENERFYCEKCETYNIGGRLRYKLTIRVVDDTGTAPFLMWDRECLALIGKSASELTSDGELHDLPIEIEALSDRKSLFKVEVKPEQRKNYTGAFTVTKVGHDPDDDKVDAPKLDEEDFKPACTLNDFDKIAGDDPDISKNKPDIQVQKRAPQKRKSLLEEFSTPMGNKRGRKLIKKE